MLEPSLPETMPEKTSPWLTSEEMDYHGIIRGDDCRISRLARLYVKRLKLGSHVRIDDFAILTGTIEIGSYVHIPPFSGLYGKHGIYMADYTGVSPACFVYTESDDYSGDSLMGPTVPEWTKETRKGPVAFYSHAVIGHGVIVLPGVTLRQGSIVGALSLVKQDCEAWTIYGGVPAKPIKMRSQKLLDHVWKLQGGA